MVWTESEGAFAKVNKALRNAHHEKVIGVLSMELSELAEHSCKPVEKIVWNIAQYVKKIQMS